MIYNYKLSTSKMVKIAVLSLAFVSTTMTAASIALADQQGGMATFNATIKRVVVPAGLVVPETIAAGTEIAGSLKLQRGDLNKYLTDNFYWAVSETGKPTGSIELGAPLDTSINTVSFNYSPGATTLRLSCVPRIAATNPSKPWCEFSKSTMIENEPWIPSEFALLVPVTEIENPEDLKQHETLENVAKIVNSEGVSALISYKKNQDAGPTEALKVILTIDELKIQ